MAVARSLQDQAQYEAERDDVALAITHSLEFKDGASLDGSTPEAERDAGALAITRSLESKNVASLDGSNDEGVKLAVARSLQDQAQYKAVGRGEVALAIT